ncbi:inorganic diphosphatase [Candidatus Peregrinibacteria bacterium]|jgi:inorganic pyrophosphatase|nr:inorganic diphosphatase [Candidatus Peregrinibacteria bacterium]
MNLVTSIAPYNSKGDLQIIVDVPRGCSNKYEYDHDLGTVILDRVLSVPMQYPFEYGFVPQTLAEDGDPVDVCVYTTYPTVPACLLKVRPIGVLYTEDEAGIDPKIICVPSDKTDPRWREIKSVDDLGEHRVKELKLFFREYKKLEPEKYEKIKIGDIGSVKDAKEIIEKAVEAFKAH